MAAKQINWKQFELAVNFPVGFDATNMGTSAGGADQSITIAADADRPNCLSQIWVSYSATPTGGGLKVENGSGTTVWGPFPIAAAGLIEVNFCPPLQGSKNTALIVTATSGGGAVTSALYVNAFKLE